MATKAHRLNVGSEANLPATWTDNDTIFVTENGVYRSTSTDGTEQPLKKLYDLALYGDAVLLRNTGASTLSSSATITKAMEGKLHYVESLTDVTFTIPTDETLNFEIGASISFSKEGPGNVIIAAAEGVTIQAALDLFTLSTTYEIIHIRKKAPNEWRVYGGDL